MIITPNIGVGTSSLASPLLNPAGVLAEVPMSNPNAAAELAAGTSDGQANSVRDAALVQSGHIADRSA
jgi:hypothetical protein